MRRRAARQLAVRRDWSLAEQPPELLFERMVRNGETFWMVVYQPFMDRDMTRDDLRALVRHGLTLTRGSYKGVAQLFNVPADYKRLLNFLRKYHCHLPIHEFRALPVTVPSYAPLARAVGD